MTTTQLKGDALLAKIEEIDSTFTATVKAIECGYLKENGKVDYTEFYTQLLAAKGLLEKMEEKWASENEELRVKLSEEWGEEAVDAFVEIWSEDDLEFFTEAYQGAYESGADFAEDHISDCFGVSNLPIFVEINWEATWQNLQYDYCEQDGYIFSVNW